MSEKSYQVPSEVYLKSKMGKNTHVNFEKTNTENKNELTFFGVQKFIRMNVIRKNKQAKTKTS